LAPLVGGEGIVNPNATTLENSGKVKKYSGKSVEKRNGVYKRAGKEGISSGLRI
jgi:hypothetical protein